MCPHNCVIREGKCGICNTRCNVEGELDLPYYGRISSSGLDPIEKKPLYHFYPASTIFSVGFWGCSFRCPFCQNYRISQYAEKTDYVSPARLSELALRSGSFGIAYTYSEPLIHVEYLIESATEARKRGLKNVLVSNGYANPEPAKELLGLMDAANIDLKAFTDDFYKKELGGGLEEVKRFITDAAGATHLEVTTLVIPGKNSDAGEIESIARFLASLSRDIPFHLSCYFPQYKYNVAQTPARMVEELAQIARKHLRYVYMGNAGSRGTDTLCPDCGNLIIRRAGYATEIVDLENGSCGKCGTKIPILGA